ncbi:hypothetical protein Trydic_g3061 [Trypoxylus dichotomus]
MAETATDPVVALPADVVTVRQSLLEASQQDYGMLVKALQLRCGNQHVKQVYQTQLGAETQRNGKGLQESEADECLVPLVCPSACSETLRTADYPGVRRWYQGPTAEAAPATSQTACVRTPPTLPPKTTALISSAATFEVVWLVDECSQWLDRSSCENKQSESLALC